MLILLFVILLIAAFIRPKSGAVTALIMISMWVAFWMPYYQGDLQTYEKIYNVASMWTMEPGYGVLVKTCLSLGLSFGQFRVVIATIYVLLMYRAIRRFTEYTAMAMLVTCIFPLFVFVSVIRSGLACVLVLNGLASLCSEKKGKNIAFIAWVLLAASIHRSALVFVIAVFLQRKLNNLYIIVLMCLSVLFAILLNYTDIIQTIISSITNRGLGYFTSSETRANFTGMVAEIIVLLANVFYSKIACIENNKAISQGKKDTLKTQQTELAFNISVAWFLMLPLMIIANPFMRFVYMTFPMITATFTSIAYNAGEGAEIIDKKPGMFPIANFITLALALLMELFFEAPYLADGQYLFETLLNPYIF